MLALVLVSLYLLLLALAVTTARAHDRSGVERMIRAAFAPYGQAERAVSLAARPDCTAAVAITNAAHAARSHGAPTARSARFPACAVASRVCPRARSAPLDAAARTPDCAASATATIKRSGSSETGARGFRRE